MMMDENGSGRVSQAEVHSFLRAIAPKSTARHEIRALAAQIMREADANRSGLITYSEFMQWPGKQAVLNWIDAYQSIVMVRYGGVGAATVSALHAEHARVADSEVCAAPHTGSSLRMSAERGDSQ